METKIKVRVKLHNITYKVWSEEEGKAVVQTCYAKTKKLTKCHIKAIENTGVKYLNTISSTAFIRVFEIPLNVIENYGKEIVTEG